MKSKDLACYLLWIGLMLAASHAFAQEVQSINLVAERRRISAERTIHESAFLQSERLCYARFAVSDCLHQARQNRRAVLDPLRRQELVLNEMERKLKAFSAMNRIQEKVSAQQPKSPDVVPLRNGPISAP